MPGTNLTVRRGMSTKDVQHTGAQMNLTKLSLTFLTFTTAVPLLAGVLLRGAAQTMPSGQSSSTSRDDSTQVKIARAMSAGPTDVAKAARIVDTDTQGNTVVLREGSNGFTCNSGNLKVVGEPPMCVDAASSQWFADAKAHKPRPTNTVPGITYMLAGATQRSDSDPNDKTSPAITMGPHWMIMWPFDPKTTGLPTTHKSTGAYIMWAGSPYAHLHVMGRP
jgi:hypothetical protein